MKVLMVTPAVDEKDSFFGFIPTWINNLAQRVDKLHVITLGYNEETQLSKNVTVYSLGKKSGKLSKLLYFNSIILRIIPKVDVVFCHMFPDFTLISAPYAKLFRKPIVTWYVHRHVSRRLRLAHFLASKMVTASEESLRIKSDKIIITGHGIDTDRFKPAIRQKREGDKMTILSVGRISPIKDYETLVRAADIIINQRGMKDLEFLIVGGVQTSSETAYYEGLRKMVEELKLNDYVKFVGFVPYRDIIRYHQQCDIHVNLCPTGGLDKAVLEAMACEKPEIVCNEAFRDLLKPYDDICLFRHQDPRDMAEKIKDFAKFSYEDIWAKIGKHNREKVIKNHSIFHLVNKLVGIFEEVYSCQDLENK